VQLLRVCGAEVVGIASEANHDWLPSLGVTPVAYGGGGSLADRLRAAAAGGVTAVIDTFGPDWCASRSSSGWRRTGSTR